MQSLTSPLNKATSGADILREALHFLKSLGHSSVETKFKNISGKTGRYNVPEKLWQKRTKRSNRVLIPWSHVDSNNLNKEHLESFEGGVTVEFVNAGTHRSL